MAEKLADRFMLVELNMQCPTGMIKSPAIVVEAETTHGVSEGGRVKASIDVFNTEYLKEVRKEQAALRNYLNDITLPWSDGRGPRLIENSAVKGIRAQADTSKIAASAKWKTFMDNIESHKARDKQVLGTLYDESNYPTREELKDKFSIEIVFSTVPDPDTDVRAGWDSQTKAEYKEQVVRDEKRRSAKAMKVLAERCHGFVERVADRCEKYTGGREGSFSNTLIDNVKDTIEMCKLFNINEDPEIDEWILEMSTSIATVTPKELREDDELRAEVGEAAKSLAKRIETSGIGAFGTPPVVDEEEGFGYA